MSKHDFYRLDVRAFDALDLFGVEPVELMSFLYIFFVEVLRIVVTESACEELGAFLALLLACAFVMLTSLIHDLVLLFLLIRLDLFLWFFLS